MRQQPTRLVENKVLMASRRRCCLCLYLNNRDEVRKGQIAHLNHDPNDSEFENLVFLCLEHHDDYDGKTSQSKAFSIYEVRGYRDRLYAKYSKFEAANSDNAVEAETAELAPLPETSTYESVRKRLPSPLDFTSEPWRFPLYQVANEPEFFAYKSRSRKDGVCLIERVDLPDGRIAVVCIQTAGNPGMSITNCVEDVCFQVCERFEIPPERLVWLEHYDSLTPDEWSMVTFARCPPNGPFEDPKWTTMTSDLWRGLWLRPRKKLVARHGQFESKVKKLFRWPTEETS